MLEPAKNRGIRKGREGEAKARQILSEVLRRGAVIVAARLVEGPRQIDRVLEEEGSQEGTLAGQDRQPLELLPVIRQPVPLGIAEEISGEDGRFGGAGNLLAEERGRFRFEGREIRERPIGWLLRVFFGGRGPHSRILSAKDPAGQRTRGAGCRGRGTTGTRRKSDVEVEGELGRVRPEPLRLDLFLELVLDPCPDHVLGEDVALEQKCVVLFERPERLFQ